MKRWHLILLAVVTTCAALLLLNVQRGRGPQRKVAGPRIVSLAPSVTEMIFSLGLGEQLIGATDCCDFPPAARGIPRVGGLGAPNLEKLLSLHPDLVIATDFQKKEYLDALQGAGIEVMMIQARTIQDVFDSFRRIAGRTGKADAAEGLVRDMERRLRDAAERYRDVPPSRRVRVYVEVGNNPIYTAGGSSFVDDVIARAGGVNVAHDLTQEYPKVSAEKVIAWNPDVIVLGRMVELGGGRSELAGRIGWDGIAAVRNNRVIDDFPPDLLLRPGPRLIDGVVELSKRFYPHSATASSGAAN